MKRMNKRPHLILSLLLLSVLLLTSCGARPAPVPQETTQAVTFEDAAEMSASDPILESSSSSVSTAVDNGKTYYEILMEEINGEPDQTPEEETARDKGLARYAELEKELADFDAVHDAENLSEEENVQRIAITDEMLELKQLYIDEPYSPSDAEMVEQTVCDRILEYNDYLYYQNKLAQKDSSSMDEATKNNLISYMERTLVKYNYLTLMERDYQAGKNPKGLMIEFDRFNRKLESGGWKDFLMKEPYWDEVWNNGVPIGE